MDTVNLYEVIVSILNSPKFYSGIRVLMLIGLGLPFIMIVSRIMSNFSKSYGSAHFQLLVRRAFIYLGVIFVGISILHELGFQITALLGAAGIAGAAFAFASQTSVSNIISGLFLLTEQSFSLHDVIEINGIMGNVESIDLLSIKMRTFDQKLVRIPNETLIKSDLRNISFYPHRRLNFTISVSHTENARKVINIINKTIAANEFSDKNKEPLVYLKEHGESTMHVFVGAYALQKNYFPMLKTLILEVKEALDADEVSVPYEHLKVLTSSDQAGQE